MSKDFIAVRIDSERKKQIEAVAALEGISISDFIRNATLSYLSKDISWQGQVQGSVEALRSDTKRIEKSVDLLSKLFIHFTEYYFTYTKSFGNMPDSQKLILVEEGQTRSKSMIDAFKKNMKNKPGLLEILLADFLVQEKNTK